ncbi:NAD(P)H-hydrate dehydratase [Halovulum sp. GXIMD14793]
MTELLTAAQMRAIEQAAINSGQVTGLELMERAGRSVVEAVLEEWPEMAKAPHRAVVLCGPGNNGGDGFVVARLLKQRGWEVEVFLYGDDEKLPPDAVENCRRWREMGDIYDLSKAQPFIRTTNSEISIPDVLVDGLFGIGLKRPVDSPLSDFFADIADDDPGMLCKKKPYIVSIDIPSGFCGDSGQNIDAAIISDLVVTFQSPKAGHFLGGLATSATGLKVADIGLGPEVTKFLDQAPSTRLHLCEARPDFVVANMYFENRHVGKQHPHLKPQKLGLGLNKYDHGHALLLSGPATQTGAIRLAARGALRVGAGLVTIGAHPDACAEHAAQLTAIMLRQMVNHDVLAKALEDTRINALCLGPGLGLNAEARQMIRTALASKRATVLDADALTLLAQDDDPFADLHKACVLTPHGGEFTRLFPDLAEKLDAPATSGPAYSKVDATHEAAARAGCTVLFKGPDTVIADPSGRAVINSAHYDRAAPWLATAGSGDVLAGFITGLLARGFGPMAAAETAAWLHVECALKFGPGLIAEDLPEQLPAVFRDLGL